MVICARGVLQVASGEKEHGRKLLAEPFSLHMYASLLAYTVKP